MRHKPVTLTIALAALVSLAGCGDDTVRIPKEDALAACRTTVQTAEYADDPNFDMLAELINPAAHEYDNGTWTISVGALEKGGTLTGGDEWTCTVTPQETGPPEVTHELVSSRAPRGEECPPPPLSCPP